MGFPLAEVLRIGATAVGGALAGPPGALAVGALTGLANQIDKEDDPATPSSIRTMKQKRREEWIKYRLGLEKDNLKKVQKYPEASRDSVKRALDDAASRDLEAVIRGDIFETENRHADDDEVRLYANAVSARVREKI